MTEPASPRASSDAGSLHLLIVEDSPTQAEALRALLSDAGYDVAVARSGADALAQLRARPAALVVSDVVMPGMTGFELCHAVRGDALLRETPFVLLTSLTDPLDVMRGLACGADNYVGKPYEPEQLLRRIARTLETHARPVGSLAGPIDLTFLRTRFTITANRRQILDVLVSSFEDMTRATLALRAAEEERERLYVQERQARVDAEDARRRAEEANQAKSEFLAMMSHDLRTPLNAIGGYAELLAMGIRGPVSEAQLADLERIRRNQRHLLALVNDVLSFARLETGEIPLTLVAVPLDATVRPLRAVIEPQAVARGIRYEYVGCAPAICVTADADRVEQILINLLGNAVKFTPEGGRIVMRCAVEGGCGIVEVEDTGIGIPADKLAAVFDPFVQVDANRGKREGVGLGLAISRKLARLMGGEITVESEEGKGSRFRLRLPMADG